MYPYIYHNRLPGGAAEILPVGPQGTFVRYLSINTLTSLWQGQSVLILPSPLQVDHLSKYTGEICGFFIVETHVLNTTGTFRSAREVEELWDALVARLSRAVEDALRMEKDPDVFLRVKECLIAFIMTLEVNSDLQKC